MDNFIKSDIDSIKTDRGLQERTNPVFNTAKMTLDLLGYAGDKTAVAISEQLGLTHEETMNSKTVKGNETDMLVNSLVNETRFRTTHELALASGCKTIIDLPCGYTPHAVYYIEAGRKFIGLDLPAAIEEAESAIRSQIPEDKQKDAAFFGVDATNLASLESAISGVTGEVCITTEGLTMYFTEPEAEALCDNVCHILKKYGGCWINADIEVSVQHLSTLRAVLGDEIMKRIRQASQKRVEEKSGFKITGNSLLCGKSGDIKKDTEKLRSFLAAHGLKGERMIISEHMPQLASLSRLSGEQQQKVRDALSRCAFWKITLTDEAAELDAGEVFQKGFDVKAGIAGSVLKLKLTGRADSMTAPRLLGLFEKAIAENGIKAVEIDCSGLEYISSAGLRVLIIMKKKCEHGVTMNNVRSAVNDILDQTGFDRLINFG